MVERGLRREPGLGEVVWHELDLEDPRTFKTSFMEKEVRLDILSKFLLLPFTEYSNHLVNNAAVA